jgi:flagellar hook-associated protein 3 FlgL
MKSTLSEIEDLDYAEAVTRMNKEMMALEAAMGSFAKISGLSLFDYIRG